MSFQFLHPIVYESTEALSIPVEYETPGSGQYQPQSVTAFGLLIIGSAFNRDTLPVGETTINITCATKILGKLNDRWKTLGIIWRDIDMLRSNAEGNRCVLLKLFTQLRGGQRRSAQTDGTVRPRPLEEVHARGADEAGDECVGRILVDLPWRAHLLDSAITKRRLSSP